MSNWTILPNRRPGDKFSHNPSPVVTINLRNGSASLNTKAVEMLGNPDAVVLMIDKAARQIGIRPAQAWDPQEYTRKTSRVAKGAKSTPRSIAFNAVLSELGFAHGAESVVRIVPKIVDGIMVLSMNEATYQQPRRESTKLRAVKVAA